MNLETVPAALLTTALVIVIGFWVFFPVLIWSQLRQVIKLLKEIRDNGQATDAKPRVESSVRYVP